MVESLTIDNFRGIEHLEVNFGHRMNVFVGENGAGKSTVLQALRYLLSWYVARMLNSEGRGIAIKQSDITSDKPFCRLKIVLDDGTQWQLCRKSNKYRGKMPYKTELTDLTMHANMLVEDHERFGGYVNFPVLGCYGVDRAVADVKPKLSKKSKLEPLDSYDARLNNGHSFISFFSWFREAEDIENETYRESGKLKADVKLSAVRQAMESVSKEFSGFRISRNPRDFLMKKGDKTFSINQLSDGEKCYLTLVGDIARMMAMTNVGEVNPLAGKGYVLIDEVDLHLHPQWQSEILGRLTEIFPNCQFVITTHSPFVVSNVRPFEDDKFFMMRHCEALEVTGNTYGKRIDEILLEFFRMQSLRNPEVEHVIDEIWNQLTSKNRDQGRLNQLKQWLMERVDNADEAVARINLEEARQRMQKL